MITLDSGQRSYRHYMVMTSVLDVASAQVSRSSGGMVRVDDPGSPFIVEMRIDSTSNPPRIVELTVTSRESDRRGISAATLSRLPLAQMRHLAITCGHPNDVLWHARVTPRPPGSRSWGISHWQEVAAVYDWAIRTGRPNGGARAVADMWGIATNPTAYRWIRAAKTAIGWVPLTSSDPAAASSP